MSLLCSLIQLGSKALVVLEGGTQVRLAFALGDRDIRASPIHVRILGLRTVLHKIIVKERGVDSYV